MVTLVQTTLVGFLAWPLKKVENVSGINYLSREHAGTGLILTYPVKVPGKVH